MIIKLSQFEGYVPDLEPEDLLLKLFGDMIGDQTDPDDLQRTCFQLKQQFPDFFKDISFNHDPEFPFSREIDEGYRRLQVCGFIG